MLQVKLDLQTARQDNHSGNKGGQIPNAAWEMVKFLNTMIDSIPGVVENGLFLNTAFDVLICSTDGTIRRMNS